MEKYGWSSIDMFVDTVGLNMKLIDKHSEILTKLEQQFSNSDRSNVFHINELTEANNQHWVFSRNIETVLKEYLKDHHMFYYFNKLEQLEGKGSGSPKEQTLGEYDTKHLTPTTKIGITATGFLKASNIKLPKITTNKWRLMAKIHEYFWCSSLSDNPEANSLIKHLYLKDIAEIIGMEFGEKKRRNKKVKE